MAKRTYTSTCHMAITTLSGGADLWPDTEANRKAGRTVTVELEEKDAEHYGAELVPCDKQVTTSKTK